MDFFIGKQNQCQYTNPRRVYFIRIKFNLKNHIEDRSEYRTAPFVKSVLHDIFLYIF